MSIDRLPTKFWYAIYCMLFVITNVMVPFGVLPSWIISARMEAVPAELNFIGLYREQGGGRGRKGERWCIKTSFSYKHRGVARTGTKVWNWYRDECVPVWIKSAGEKIVSVVDMRSAKKNLLAYVDPLNPDFAVLFPMATGGPLSPLLAIAFVIVWIIFLRNQWRWFKKRTQNNIKAPSDFDKNKI